MDREVEECIVTRDETKQILMRISSVYPNWKPQADLKFVVETWCEYLEEYSYEQIRAALKVYIATDTSGFAPSIGQLIDKLHTISRPQELSEMEAWELVSRALRNG
ncbi:MAG: replicative helicase loader/inhibitor [Acetivibrio ethanolgignens]